MTGHYLSNNIQSIHTNEYSPSSRWMFYHLLPFLKNRKKSLCSQHLYLFAHARLAASSFSTSRPTTSWHIVEWAACYHYANTKIMTYVPSANKLMRRLDMHSTAWTPLYLNNGTFLSSNSPHGWHDTILINGRETQEVRLVNLHAILFQIGAHGGTFDDSIHAIIQTTAGKGRLKTSRCL